MSFVVKPKPVTAPVVIRDGTYPATLSNVSQFANIYGERIGFEFTINSGDYKGQKVMRSTATELTKMSKLAQVIEGILGRNLTSKELSSGVDLESMVGHNCQILVLQSQSKSGTVYSNVERVFN
jgi:hypothetical protein